MPLWYVGRGQRGSRLPARPGVAVTCRRQRHERAVSVRTNGIGIPVGQAERVFRDFRLTPPAEAPLPRSS